jgi:hypothetical protein
VSTLALGSAVSLATASVAGRHVVDLAIAEGDLIYEPRFNRWHRGYDCPVLAAQPEATVHTTTTPGNARACTICAASSAPAEFAPGQIPALAR